MVKHAPEFDDIIAENEKLKIENDRLKKELQVEKNNFDTLLSVLKFIQRYLENEKR